MVDKIEKTKNELLNEKISNNPKSAWFKATKKDVFDFSNNYMEFIGNSKTERLAVINIVTMLKEDGFKDISSIKNIKTGDKIYKNFKGKVVLALVVGENMSDLRIIGSHIDSPRLDLKPNPLYEDSQLCLMQTHYYGGVKKYHWVNTPLSLIGVVMTKSGKKIEISIGEKDSEPKFIIPDLLPHLAKKQMEKTAPKVVEGEELNILVGNIPVDDDKIKEKVKFGILKHLYEKYDIIEEDFCCAELELVPSAKPTNIGFDESMIGAYGQDDKVCAFTSVKALLECKSIKSTAIGFFVDKEEIGSAGDTGARSQLLENFVNEYRILANLKVTVNSLLENAKSVSADVTAAMNPSYKDVHDPNNVSYIGKGVSIEKYGGGGGKYSTNDASAEYMQFIRNILDKENITWQTGELGKIDIGGGGTIAMFLSRYGMDCLDVGPCVLAMHSPCEITSKVDVYNSYLFYKAFFNS